MAIELDHIILSVADVEESVRIYYRTLGFRYEPVALVRITPTLVLQLIQRPPQISEHLAFSMSKAEVGETAERLKAANIPYGDNFDTVGNMKGPGRASGSKRDGNSIYFRDPDQHMIEVIHYET